MLLPILYLRGLSTGDFQEALAALLGKDAPGCSASTISRLKETWSDETSAGASATCRPGATSTSGRMASTCRHADEEQQCILVLIGATPEGSKELIGFTDGSRESEQAWRELLLDLKRRA